MLTGLHATRSLFLVAMILLSIKTVSTEKIANCQTYKIESNDEICSQCMYGYDIDAYGQCSPTKLVTGVSIVMAVKNIEPFIRFRNIFCEFIGDFWFFASNQTHSRVTRELTQLMIAINNERLWPFDIKEKFQLLVGKQNINQFHNFLGQENKSSQRSMFSTKRDLFMFEKRQFFFTLGCGIKLLCSLGICLAIWIGLQLIEGILYLLTSKRLLEKRQIKGSLILMTTGQLYHFVGFYGFYQLKSLQGYSQFGMKLNIAVTILTLFVFAFLSLTIQPIAYYINENHSLKSSSRQSTQSQTKIIRKVQRVITFANSPQGFTYYLIHGHFRNFCSGCIIGYFYDGSIQYVILALWYGIEYFLMEDIGDSLSAKIYFMFRKGYIVMTIIFLTILYEQNSHVFSDPNYSFRPIQEICLCFLYVLSITQFMLQLTEILWKFLTKIKNWLKIKNKVYNTGPLKNIKSKSAKRRHLRQPSIAQRVLTTLKTIKGY